MNDNLPSGEGQPTPERRINQPTKELADLLNGAFLHGKELDDVGRDALYSDAPGVRPGVYVYADPDSESVFHDSERILLRPPDKVSSRENGFTSKKPLVTDWIGASFHVERPVNVLPTGETISRMVPIDSPGEGPIEMIDIEYDGFTEERPDAFVVYIGWPRAEGRIPEQLPGREDEAYFIFLDENQEWRLVDFTDHIANTAVEVTVEDAMHALATLLHDEDTEQDWHLEVEEFLQDELRKTEEAEIAVRLITFLTADVTLIPFTFDE